MTITKSSQVSYKISSKFTRKDLNPEQLAIHKSEDPKNVQGVEQPGGLGNLVTHFNLRTQGEEGEHALAQHCVAVENQCP